jgi:hypothetical protein
MAIGLFVGLATDPYRIAMLPGAIMFAVEAFFLFRPAASAYFANEQSTIVPSNPPSTRRIVGVIVYVLAGFLFTCMGMTKLMPGPAPGGKTFVLLFFLLPFSVCLAIGESLAAGNWKVEVGTVFVVGSLVGGRWPQ